MNIPREEYPRPQMVRKDWVNLNGLWEFEFDFGKTGRERHLIHKDKFEREILVPFCPESKLSGIEYTDFMNSVWYRRTFSVPQEWRKNRILIHFEAVDYDCEVWINGTSAGRHKGGYTPFTFDISALVTDGENTLTVCVEDDNRTGLQPSGKQSNHYNSKGCLYTRVTGIWQTVWLESVPETHIKSYKITPDIDNGCVHISMYLSSSYQKKHIAAKAYYEGKEVGHTTATSNGSSANFTLKLSELHIWQPLDPKLYDIELTLSSDGKEDKITGYFGMRTIEIAGNCVLINGKPVFQRLVLDQGYYPGGIYTAPSDEALRRDIELSLALGFNGARLHQKVFERRFLYWADKLGYIVWGEYGNWGFDHTKASALGIFMPEWLEAVERDYNSPALIGWCPFNETWDVNGSRQNNALLKDIYLLTKAVDKTRPVIDTSGNFHVITDIYDIHTYEQDVDKFRENFSVMSDNEHVYDNHKDRQTYMGQPYFVSEYGGIWWNSKDEKGWGYGTRPESIEEFAERFEGMADILLTNPRIFALCYTQLYDVEQEVNGLYYYDRTPKFPPGTMQRFKKALQQTASIEQNSVAGF
ncbi:MAG: glycoside hydrolase family 2 TIM barrel-domain containing protein [Bacillota bacterium]|nr:glycoside hydrolase family 2 TIM barrel-domain containing protein [Bacillota bacterium]